MPICRGSCGSSSSCSRRWSRITGASSIRLTIDAAFELAGADVPARRAAAAGGAAEPGAGTAGHRCAWSAAMGVAEASKLPTGLVARATADAADLAQEQVWLAGAGFELVRRLRLPARLRRLPPADEQARLRRYGRLPHAGRRTVSSVTAVGSSAPTPARCRRDRVEVGDQTPLSVRVEDREHQLDAAEEVPVHPVRARAIDLFASRRCGSSSSASARESGRRSSARECFRRYRDARPQAADAAHDQVHVDAGSMTPRTARGSRPVPRERSASR
jgi:hypothetical protein